MKKKIEALGFTNPEQHGKYWQAFDHKTGLVVLLRHDGGNSWTVFRHAEDI